MQIQLVQAELEEAVRQYVSSMGISAPVNDINFTAGRGEAGITASINVGSPEVREASAPKATLTVLEDPVVAPEEDSVSDAIETEEEAEASASLFG